MSDCANGGRGRWTGVEWHEPMRVYEDGGRMSETNELLPCPFCSGESLVCEGGINGRLTKYGLVEHKDGCFFLSDGLPTKNQHIIESDFESWNTRANRTTTRNGKYKTKYGRKVPLCECCGYAIGDSRYNYCPNCGAKVVIA